MYVQPGLFAILNKSDQMKATLHVRYAYMNRWAVNFVVGSWRSSNARPSVRDFTAALAALYAAFPGGFVIPCFDPVLMITELHIKNIINMTQSFIEIFNRRIFLMYHYL